MKCDKSFLNIDKHLIISLVYLPPYGVTYYQDKHSSGISLFEDLFAPFIIQCTTFSGDLNSRTDTILKRKSIATLTKMLVLFFGPKQSLSDNAIEKSLYLPWLQHKNQNGVAYGCRAATIILRQPLILKSHGYNTSHVMRKIFF